MKKRPWIPIAVVLLVLVGATLAVGSVVRSRLAEAELALQPFMQPDVVGLIDDGDAPLPICAGSGDVEASLQDFYAAAALEDDEISTTSPSFDSFFLESAIARAAAGKHQLLLKALPERGVWCLSEADFTTEE